MKLLKNLFILAVILYFIFSLFQTEFDSLRPEAELSEGYTHEVARLAAMALSSKDVPVGAIVIYDGKIVGRGYNTVKKYNDLTGHAEINALNDAVENLGLEEFNQLDRGKLLLVSSYEPCEMCKGTMVHYNIRKTIVLKDKSLWHWWVRDLHAFWYELDKKRTGDAQIQDSLFLLHPDYPGSK